MKHLHLIFLLIHLAFGETKPPEPIKEHADREKIHAAQKAVLGTQLELLRVRDQPLLKSADLRQTEQAAQDAGRAWNALLTEIQKKFKAAPGCALDLDLKWHCQPEKP
jgi:hypothetical protein